jgi:hypothetical protein
MLLWSFGSFIAFFDHFTPNTLADIPMHICVKYVPVSGYCIITVKRVDKVVLHPHRVKQDQFSLVTGKASGIHEDNFTINIELFRPTLTCVELLRCKHIPNVELFRWYMTFEPLSWIVSKVTPPESDVLRLHFNTLLYNCATLYSWLLSTLSQI